MVKVLEYSITHFCEHILKLHLQKAENIGGELYGASIPIEGENVDAYHFYLFFPEEILKKFADVLVSNHKFKEDNWCDLSKECANQIIGYAKNLFNDGRGKGVYKLGIPEYLGRVDFSKIVLDEALSYELDGYFFRIGFIRI